MLELLFIRHGQTDWNASQKVMGRQPIPLNDAGRAQARELAGFLEGTYLAAVISSPVKRAAETAEIIAASKGLGVEFDRGLSEIDYGDWVNLSFADLVGKYGGLWHKYKIDPNDVVLPGGESMRDVKKRVGRFVDKVCKRFDSGRVALVSHADIIKIALIHLFKLDLKQMACYSIDNCAMLLVRFYEETGPRLVLYNALNGFGKDL